MPRSWTYKRVDVEHVIEVAFRAGPQGPAQVGHFHDEVQIVAVREGRWSYATPLGTFRAEAGEIIVLPAGLFHAPLTRARSFVVNVYLAQNHPAVRHIATPVVLDAFGAAEFPDVIDRVASACPHFASVSDVRSKSNLVRRLVNTRELIQVVATAEGLSVDGFIRSFARQVGATPAQYRIAHRLNVARALLRHGATPADTAHESGFADQSHLGRCFLRAYGTTPAAYRAGMQQD